MSGTRRARTLVAGIQSSLGAALALADRLEAQADELERGGGPGAADAAGGPVDPLDIDAEIAQARGIIRSQARGFAGLSWSAPDWQRAPLGAGPARYRPGLWRVGRVVVGAGATATSLPLAVPLLDARNLRIEISRARRGAAVDLVRGLLARILAEVPAGRVRVIVYDPHELGAGLAGLAPLRAAGVVEATITTRARLEERLSRLSDEVGRITVERLGGQFDSLRDREDAGHGRPEPWQVLVLLGEPQLYEEGGRSLAAIAAQGPACGVSVISIVPMPTPQPGEGGFDLDDDHAAPPDPDVADLGFDEETDPVAPPLPNAVVFTSVDLLTHRGHWREARPGQWRTSLTGQLPVELDEPPPTALVTHVSNQIADAARQHAARPPGITELLPTVLWESDSSAGVSVAVARGVDGPVALTFDDDTVHALVGGQAGAGKSTLLLDVVYGIAARYSPEQVRFHLLDFKEGLEFAQFATGPVDPFFLPHADTVGIESDREFGVAVLRAVREQMRRRSVAMRAVGARDLRGLRAGDRSSAWPRIIIVVDEFQVMLTPLDEIAREAVAHLEVLARQGRAYGIHLLLASQTLSGIDALDSTAGKRGSIFGQFALRVALRTSISESRVLLSTANEAAGALAGVGEAIVNRRNGHPAGNEHVRVAFPDAAAIAVLRDRLSAATARSLPGARPPRVFVGHAPALLDDNAVYRALDGHPAPLAVDRIGIGAAADSAAAASLDVAGLDVAGVDVAGVDVAGVGAEGLVPAKGTDIGTFAGLDRVAGPLDGDGAGRAGFAVGTGPGSAPRMAAGRSAGAVGGPTTGGDPLALVGVPVDLAPAAVGVRFAASPGRHLAVLGPLRREAMGIVQAAAASVAAQVGPGGLIVEIVAAEPTARGAAEVLAERIRRAGHPARVTDVTGLRGVLAAAAGETRAREDAALAGTVTSTPALRLVVVFAMDAGRAGLEARDEATRRTGLEDLRTLTRRGPAQRVHLIGWWRGVSRMSEDLGPVNRDDIAAWAAVGVPGSELFALAGHRPVAGGTMPNRAVLFDRHTQSEPRTVVPFTPLVRG
ncbi:DNA segregation ATPase, FtsK/SpoIIIE family [Frankia sp. AiPs1]|uniref:FtsK/SpoIIIE domain-containing protein n=1 Tax=Frankia sp. AiPa1 TaxID=573492 RepID=UPI00202B2DC5|nr:FtsK/SpoIIIE domain-containing protein [Frankia sp. AiPa1]MCL9761564.1 FtsK/SpoIIIE domain-containing protein [Frankia sp. AiPa1]